MIAAFTHGPGNTVVADLRAADTRLLAQLFGNLLELLADPDDDPHRAGPPPAPDPLAVELGLTALGDGPSARRPDDPALARLFPDAYPEDPDASAEFRRYTQPDLSAERRRRAALAAAALERIPRGGRLTLAAPEAGAWLGALNDLRLVIGTRLELTDDGQEPGANLPPGDPRANYVPVYYYLGYLQETLVEALTP